jgi:glutamate formiminotransferase / 5-formyltetrahydrofolate cyclo-ligase
LLERGHVQVTMNILDFKKNPIYRILETVKMEARRYRVMVTSAEIIGLLPQEALVDSVKYYLQAEGKSVPKEWALDDLVAVSVQTMGLRDFTKMKIIEAYL